MNYSDREVYKLFLNSVYGLSSSSSPSLTFKDLIPKTITVGELRLIDRARLPETSSWPIARNTVLGGLAGAVIAIAIIIIKDMLDTTIRTKKDLEDKFEDIPVIGTIPGIKQR